MNNYFLAFQNEGVLFVSPLLWSVSILSSSFSPAKKFHKFKMTKSIMTSKLHFTSVIQSFFVRLNILWKQWTSINIILLIYIIDSKSNKENKIVRWKLNEQYIDNNLPAWVIQSRYPLKSSSICCFSLSLWKSPRAFAFSLSLENSLNKGESTKYQITKLSSTKLN